MAISPTARPSVEQLPLWAQSLIEEQQHTIARLTTRLRVYEDFDHVPKEVLSHSQRATVRSAIKIIQEGHPNRKGLIEFHTSELGADTDQERKTIGTHLRRAHAIGILQYHTELERHPNTGKVIATHVFIGATLLTFEPRSWRAPRDLARKVGAAAHCPNCGSKRIRNRVIRECVDCGHKISDTGDGNGTAFLEPPEDEYIDGSFTNDGTAVQILDYGFSEEPEGVNRPVIPTLPPEGEVRSTVSPAFQAMKQRIREDLVGWHHDND